MIELTWHGNQLLYCPNGLLTVLSTTMAEIIKVLLIEHDDFRLNAEVFQLIIDVESLKKDFSLELSQRIKSKAGMKFLRIIAKKSIDYIYKDFPLLEGHLRALYDNFLIQLPSVEDELNVNVQITSDDEKLINIIINCDYKPLVKAPEPINPYSQPSNLSLIDEATAGIACEEQGLLKLLSRDRVPFRGVFIERDNVWDVKTLKSYSMLGEPIFDKDNFVRAVQKELAKPVKKNIIISISDVTEADLILVFEGLKTLSKEELKKLIIVDDENPNKSKTNEQLLKHLGIE